MSASLPSCLEIRGWTVEQVQLFLQQAGLSDCCDIMLRKQVDGLALMGMNDAVLQLWSREMKIMQIKKLSKLISQLNSIEISPVVCKKPVKCQGVSTKQRSLSTSTDDDKQPDCDWGSDFEESASTPPPQRNFQFKKISAYQIPQPYKARQSLLQPEACPDYSNVQVITADVRQQQSPSPSRTNKLAQAGLISFNSDDSMRSINYSVLKKNNHQPILLPKPAYSPLEYSIIDHSKTIKSRKQNNGNKSLNGPKITSPKPSLSSAEFPGKKPCSFPLISKHSQNFRNEDENLDDEEEDYEIPQWKPDVDYEPSVYEELNPRLPLPSRYLIVENSEETNNNSSGRLVDICPGDDNEYEPIQSPEALKVENRSYIKLDGSDTSKKTTNSLFSDRCLPPPPPPESHKRTIWDPVTATVSLHTTTPTTCTTASSIAESEELRNYPWYHSIDRKQAEELLKNLNSNGGFLVRESKHGGVNSPFTLTVFNQGTVFNINIRLRPDGLFALGKEKIEENTFNSIVSMVENHKREPLKLTSATQNVSIENNTTLNCWPIKLH